MQQFSAHHQRLIDVWETHTAAEFEHRDADAAMATMTADPTLINVPVGTGATGRAAVRRFYAEVLIPQAPPDFEPRLLTRCAAQDKVVDELTLRFTHTVQMDWFAPGIAATGRPMVVPTVVIIGFEGELISTEHIYWDQATVLAQLGLIGADLPVLGADQVDRLLDRDAPVNELIERLQ